MAGVLARVNIWHRQSLPLSACGEHQFEFFWRNGVAEVLDTPLRGLAHLVEYGPEALAIDMRSALKNAVLQVAFAGR